jgi:hypothetical protein
MGCGKLSGMREALEGHVTGWPNKPKDSAKDEETIV